MIDFEKAAKILGTAVAYMLLAAFFTAIVCTHPGLFSR